MESSEFSFLITPDGFSIFWHYYPVHHEKTGLGPADKWVLAKKRIDEIITKKCPIEIINEMEAVSCIEKRVHSHL